MRAADFAQRVRQAIPQGNGWMAFCPAHDDHHNRSLSFRDADGRVLIHCFAGCEPQAVVTSCDLTMSDLFFDADGTNGQTDRIARIYDYCDEVGNLISQVLRLEPKGFRQRRPDGQGGWINNLQGVPRHCYRLPELQGQPLVMVVEGEKDVDQLWALNAVATCNSGGAGKWTDQHTAQLQAAGVQQVVIVPDNDPPGQHHADSVARSCVAAGLPVKVVTLPGLPNKGDVSDWVAAGHTIDELLALVESTPEWAVPPSSSSSDHAPEPDESSTSRIELDADVGDLADITRQALDVLVEYNNPPKLFRHGSGLVRLEADQSGRLRPVELTADRLRHELANAARWTKAKKSPFGTGPGREDTRPPLDVVKNILATPDVPLPVLRGLTEVPVVLRDGRILDQSGFDPESGMYFQPYDPHLQLEIPATPTSSDVVEAKANIDDLIGDFAFVADSDCAHAVALIVSTFARSLIDGPTPLHDVEAPSPGTGKTLLVEVGLYPAVGPNVGLMAPAKDEEECRKRVTAVIREARSVAVIDNLSRPLDSGVVSAMLTARQWDDRLLGKSETLSLPVMTIWACTGNNPIFSMEIARRTVRIRLDARTDRPWLRDGFRHEDLRRWVEEHRARLITSILTIVRAWLLAGRPGPPVKPLGSFESWSHVVGGIVTFAGYHGFLGNALEFYETADTEGKAWRIFIEQWWQTHHDRPVGVSDLREMALTVEGLSLGRATSERGQTTSLGRQLGKRRDQVISAYRIEEAGRRGGLTQWRLRAMTDAPTVPEHETIEEIDCR